VIIVEQERMKTLQHGFTLLEMMAVLAIIAILALMAAPSFMDRTVRQQIEAALPLADIAKKPVAGTWGQLSAFPADNAAAGLPVAEKVVSNHVSSLLVEDGAIQITFGNHASKAISGKMLSLRPAVVADAPVVPVAWVCGNAPAPEKMTVQGINRTNVPVSFLPLACR
jgi:type IV pilus assembly protein PilA